MAAGQTGGVVDFVGGFEAEAFARAIVEDVGDGGALVLGEGGEVGAFGEVLADQAVSIFVGAAFPGVVRSGEVDRDLEFSFDGFIGVKLSAVVGGDGFEEGFVFSKKFDRALGSVCRGRVRQFSDPDLAAEAVDDGEDACFGRTADCIDFPVAQSGPVLDDDRTLRDHFFIR